MSKRTFTAGGRRLRTAIPIVTAAVLGAATLSALGVAAPVAATAAGTGSGHAASIPGHGPRTAVTLAPDVVRNLFRLGIRVRPVDAQERRAGDHVTIVFRVVSSDGGRIEHRGGIRLAAGRGRDLLLDRPVFDLRRGTVSVSTGRGDRVTLLDVDLGGPWRGEQQGGNPGAPAAGGGGGTAIGPDHDEQATLRLTGDGERLLDRALGTRWFRAGQRIGTAQFVAG